MTTAFGHSGFAVGLSSLRDRAAPRLAHSASIPNAIAEYRQADQLWHSATDALLIGDYTEFDRLMREFRNISREWRK